MIDKLRKLIKKMLPSKFVNFCKNLMTMERLDMAEKHINTLFQLSYRNEVGNLDQKIDLANHEFKICSKVGEDGLILYIFSKIGSTNHRFVEIGVEEGRECNTANLSLNFGWQGIIVDAEKPWIEKAKAYYREKLGKSADNVKPVHCLVTAENINQLLLDNGMRGEIDLLSIDIDGNDYWVWKAISAVQPRVVVAEYNSVFGATRSLTIKYNSDHFYTSNRNHLYFGASLAALKKLGEEKGYIMIGCDTWGHDAFFVRKDLAEGKFRALSSEEAFYPTPHRLKEIGSPDQQFEQIKHLDFEQI